MPSQSGNGSYVVAVGGDDPFCSCPDFDERGQHCKHLYAVEYSVRRESQQPPKQSDPVEPEPAPPAPVALGKTWAAYDRAQAYEQELFGKLLRDLTATLPQPEQSGRGRRRLPLGDMVLALGLKIYSSMSGRRAMTSFRNAKADGLLANCPSFSSAFRYMENPELTPILKHLIQQSALPLTAVEKDFAGDASGFSTCVYDRWFDHKWGKEKKQARFVKAHVFSGVETNIVTYAEVTEANVHDSRMATELLDRTAENFQMAEVSLDKAYLSRRIVSAIAAKGAEPFIPMKVNSTSKGDSAWTRMYHYFALHREEFLAHYHKRSNAETVFAMIKAKFSGAVRSRTPAAQVNEVLVKILAHNICVLIGAMFSMGLEPDFGPGNA